MRKKKKAKKHSNNKVERWTEEQYEEYLKELYGMEFIAGFTEGGVPYGLFEEDLETSMVENLDDFSDYNEEMFFSI
ncbi:hypothetical protein [Clostridium sp.]|uniref:hypothetical protein n=1 Tax=Clostridium sp. TaxID=1506 RepID=UPI0028514499|nr:hypothetical protein [Clostridium sp.]MDR3594427.1 hypothetical protein [Clostridium sp.]